MNGWRATLEKDGVVVAELSGPLDPFEELIQKNGASTVGCNYGEAEKFGAKKLSFHVTLTCDQNTEMINKAGRLAFKTAFAMFHEGADIITELEEKAANTEP